MNEIIEGMVIQRAAPEFREELGFIPIAVEKFEGGKWVRLGYAEGFGVNGSIISEAELRAAVRKAAGVDST